MSVCELCQKEFKRKIDLSCHTKFVHEGVKEHSCGVCSKAFGRVGDLNRHLKVVHDGVKEYVCHTCQKPFGMKQHLNRHIAAVHDKVRNHVCDRCKRAFGSKGNLEKHTAAVQLRIRDQICDQCGLAFSRKSDLNHHIDRVHINPLPPAVSRGEALVRCTLTNHNVQFEAEKKFRDLKESGDGYLRYDFAIPGRDGQYLLIEFQGEQHYKPVRYSSEYTEIELLEKLRVTKLHDNLKARYAEENGFPLLAIRYDKVGEVGRLVGDFLAEHQDML